MKNEIEALAIGWCRALFDGAVIWLATWFISIAHPTAYIGWWTSVAIACLFRWFSWQHARMIRMESKGI